MKVKGSGAWTAAFGAALWRPTGINLAVVLMWSGGGTNPGRPQLLQSVPGGCGVCGTGGAAAAAAAARGVMTKVEAAAAFAAAEGRGCPCPLPGPGLPRPG